MAKPKDDAALVAKAYEVDVPLISGGRGIDRRRFLSQRASAVKLSRRIRSLELAACGRRPPQAEP
jgi:hypothetical protein